LLSIRYETRIITAANIPKNIKRRPGAKRCFRLAAGMKEREVKYGVESLCIGGGMGAAALFELCE